MLSPVVQGALNEQITTELFSSYNYLAMSAFCERQNFRGCAQWLRVQSQEEYAHAMKLYDFLLARNGKVELKAIQAPRTDYDSIPQVFAETLKQEEEVSRRIDQLYELAFKEKAFAALVQLQWFITEQVEEERTARDILSKFELVKDDPSALLDLDRELGTRTPGADAAADEPAAG
ncbi:MAG TPA: ferritin [Pirellulaceae bacterium]|nr:ferritin [Pirellulaceae bacterium]